MENSVRSERTRNAVLQAALTIIARDGPGRLTLDAIVKESGMSKGALLHHFHNKSAVLAALLAFQTEQFEEASRHFLAEHENALAYPQLAAQIDTLRQTLTRQRAIAFAVFAVVADNPDLLSSAREHSAGTVAKMKAEATDPDLALLRWAAARGLAVTELLGMCPLSQEDRDRLFDRLFDDDRWTGCQSSTL
ncbi:TetR/AcrR family transcriptional regulator [Azospirillum sp. B506]|uniref:TetR/AcrR family transcriptional regulator n=1 Tax=Azospirillum sp. B506 TaxID=137721 RepID=UPI0005B28BCB|nr:TetR/AcrR family transcriptional regulator [Azospirillum sp. B506]